MSRAIHTQQNGTILHTPAAVAAYLLDKVGRADAGLTGLEQEMFVTLPDGMPPAFNRIEAVLRRMAALLPQAELRFEGEYVVGIGCGDLGDVCLEPGGQIELSSAPSPDLAVLESRQSQLLAALEQAAADEGLNALGAGHLPAFVHAGMAPRSRFAAYAKYCRAKGGDKAEALLETMKSCTGLQVNVDPMGDDFHLIYRALMVLELANCLRDRTARQERFAKTYAPLFPAQVTPLFNALAARDNNALVGQIVERLLALHMPFVPDPANAEGFLPSAAVYGETPTVGLLMEKGVLTAELLDNALSLQMTMPNLRRHGVVETRAPDTPESLAAVMAVAAKYHRAAYDPACRAGLVALAERLDPAALAHAFDARFTLDEAGLMALPVSKDMTVSVLVTAVETAVAPKPAERKSHALRQKRANLP